MVDFTVAIRAYNAQKRLPDVLERLRSQINIEQINWEIVIVDNNSTDNTAQIIQGYQANWPKAYPLRYYFESEQGAAVARQRTIKEAKGTFIGFIDDDNLPTPNWVAAAYSFGIAHPKAGAYGSEIRGEFEVAPPENFKKIAPIMAIVDRGDKPFRYDRVLPPGAGMVIRKQAWLESVPNRLFLKGPVGTSLTVKSEDIEALSYLKRQGWEIWHNPEMCIYHQIPKWRLERQYLMDLCRGAGIGRHHIRMIAFKPWQRPLIIPFYIASDLRKVILHFIKNYRILKTDNIAACEMQLFLSTLFSPLYIWKQHYLASQSPVVQKKQPNLSHC